MYNIPFVLEYHHRVSHALSSVLLFPLLYSADILLNRSQQLFASCTARFADGQQCSIPVFDITHQTPLCEEHAKKMVSSIFKGQFWHFGNTFSFAELDKTIDNTHRHENGINLMMTRCSTTHNSQDNFLRGDGKRRVQHQQQRKPRKKTKPPALTKKHKKKRRRGPRRPQKPIPPALPQGNLGMPSTSLAMPSQASIRSATLVSLHCWLKNVVCREPVSGRIPSFTGSHVTHVWTAPSLQ